MTEQKIEAIIRMNMLGLHINAINEFKQENKLNYTEPCLMLINGLKVKASPIYWVEDSMLKEKINSFEKKTGGLVYHVIKSNVMNQEHYSFLYVSKSKDEWERDRKDIKDGYSFVWVENTTCEWCSEYGTIKIEYSQGGVSRIGQKECNYD